VSGGARRAIARLRVRAYFGTMRRRARYNGRLPTTLGFSPVEDRARMPGRFFYRQISAVHLAA
jgi:hypothetical protein